jgi:pyrophosphate--fructose-6-phosphate 1-phosphotransferase
LSDKETDNGFNNFDFIFIIKRSKKVSKFSVLDNVRKQYKPEIPAALQNDISAISFDEISTDVEVSDQDQIEKLLPTTFGGKYIRFNKSGSKTLKALTVGVVLSGGQAAGGHNVIAGLYDSLKCISKDSKLIGFLGGPSGILDDEVLEMKDAIIDEYRNTGGFDIIRSGRTKIESEEQFARSLEVCKLRNLDALVIIGGDDSNTNAALLAEYFLANKTDIKVIGVPKTIDGDLKCEFIETSFGFDTACKTYSELIGNIERDSKSAAKYWHFIKLMGRSASHIALECALQTAPNYCFISEEVKEKNMSLANLVDGLAEVVVKRYENGENYGVVLIPEGLIEFIPEVGNLIGEINNLLGINEDEFASLSGFAAQVSWLGSKLSKASAAVFASLPENIQAQLLMDRDPHGNVQVSRIETEKLLIQMTEKKLKELKKEGKYNGKFSALNHFFGYEGRCAFPSNFDANYCYSLGYIATLLISSGLTGYMSSIMDLEKPVSEWIPGGVPISMMMNMEERKGKMKGVIKKALVELDGKPFKALAAKRDEWALKTSFIYPGAIQYFGPDEVCNLPTETLKLEKGV